MPEEAHTKPVYFLKKSGILIDCSFTLLVGVLGTSSVGDVPPAGFLGIAPPAAFPFGEIIPMSICGACAALDCIFLSKTPCCPMPVTFWLSNLDFNFEALPPTL